MYSFTFLICRTLSGIESNLGTMVINEDEEEDNTMKQYGTAPGGSKYRYRFMFMIIGLFNLICQSSVRTFVRTSVPIAPQSSYLVLIKH